MGAVDPGGRAEASLGAEGEESGEGGWCKVALSSIVFFDFSGFFGGGGGDMKIAISQ